MWGDFERAQSLSPTDPLVSLLFQVTGPAHIPWEDPVWEELLHGYNVWVHIDAPQFSLTDINGASLRQHGNNKRQNSKNKNDATESTSSSPMVLIGRACQLAQQHAARTSNLAALTIHVTNMIQELTKSIIDATESPHGNKKLSSTTIIHEYHNTNKLTTVLLRNDNDDRSNSYAAFSNRITLVGKSRSVAGALNLLRILSHAVMLQSTHTGTVDRNIANSHNNNQSNQHAIDHIQDVFTYKSRETISSSSPIHRRYRTSPSRQRGVYDSFNDGFDVGNGLISCLLDLIQWSSIILPSSAQDIPELYDVNVLALQLVLVLLSTQLYKPMISSFQNEHYRRKNTTGIGHFWDILFKQARKSDDDGCTQSDWSVRKLLTVLLQWQIDRPTAPSKSIQHHRIQLIQHVVRLMGDPSRQNSHAKIGLDGLYEGYSIVQACAPYAPKHPSTTIGPTHDNPNTKQQQRSHSNANGVSPSHHPASVSDATISSSRSVFDLSSNLLFLPIRLLHLALGLLGGNSGNQHQVLQQLEQIQVQKRIRKSNRTRDVLWVTDSPLADLSLCILLLVSNNERNSNTNSNGNHARNSKESKTDGSSNDDATLSPQNNPFRIELSRMVDNRWDDSTTSTGSAIISNDHEYATYHPSHTISNGKLHDKGNLNIDPKQSHQLTINFEALFASFGGTLHNEAGALFFYTLLQVSPAFAQSIAVRSDLDTIVLPLLRTLYFATSLRHYVASSSLATKTQRNPKLSPLASSNSLLHRVESRDKLDFVDARTQQSSPQKLSSKKQNCPFRSQSQLYVIVILLLMLSQDSSFGSDAFRRIHITSVPWYKERHLKNINLGSVIVLVVLRCLVFNLNRLNDPFLLSNCCAVLMNLAPSLVDLQDYAAMRLVTVTISFIKRYLVLRKQAPVGTEESDEMMLSSLAQHGEVSRTLLRFIKLGLSTKNIDKNVHLLYALAYHNADLERFFSDADCPFRKSEVARIQAVAAAAAGILERNYEAHTAVKAFKLLTDSIERIKDVVAKQDETPGRRVKGKSDSGNAVDDFIFCYEEESDPEVFFVPYIWDVIVCTLTTTSSFVEWDKTRIRVFPLLETDKAAVEDDSAGDNSDDASTTSSNVRETVIPQFARDVSDIV